MWLSWDVRQGFAIAASFRKDTDRYQFAKYFEVVDLGLHLDDVKSWGLSSEEEFYRSDPSANLQENGATPEEIAFLHEGGSDKHHYGKRVELNEFSSDDFIKWIESKLDQQGIKKVIPDENTLKEAYARAIKVATINRAIEDAMGDAEEAADNHPVPETLMQQISERLQEKPELPWDTVVAKLAAHKILEG